MAEPATVNFTLYRGQRRVIRFTRTENGSISGQTAKFSARIKADAQDPPALDIDASILDAGSSTTPGVWGVTVSASQSLALTARAYAFSFARTDVDDLYTIGKMDVRYDVRHVAAQ